MHADKTRYITVYGIALFVKDFIIHDAKGKCFMYNFDETTTSKVEKQYNRYITHFSDFVKQVITAYSGSLFVRHCPSKDLLHHFHTFMDFLNLSTSQLLNIGMDGPTVNMSFLNQLKSEMEESHQSFIDIGACSLHITNNSFKAILNVLKPILDLDQVAADLHFFFKRSVTHREDYKMVENITGITMHYMKKNLESCWLSIDPSLVRILEQMENLRGYFLKEISKQKGFNQKNGLANNDWYKRIASVLKNPKANIYMSYIVFISQSFNRFFKTLQTSSPMIHRLYPMCLQLVHKFLGKVIQRKFSEERRKTCSY